MKPEDQLELFPPPAHYRLVDRLADAALGEIRSMAAEALYITMLRFDSVAKFVRMSAAQRRRYFFEKRGIQYEKQDRKTHP